MGNPNPSPETRFKPGQSGNPGGKPKGTPSIWIAAQRLMALSPKALADYEPVNMAEEIAKARLQASVDKPGSKDAHYLIDRQEGKTPERIQHEGEGLRVVLNRKEPEKG